MTVEEAEVLMAQSPAIRLTPGPEPGFVRMAAAPCPFYRRVTGCAVYGLRPYNCRRYLCGRDSSAEPFEQAPIPLKVLQDRSLRRQYARNQRRSQRWADAHGWRPDASQSSASVDAIERA